MALLKNILNFMFLNKCYKHPVVSLTANNPYINPAIELDRMRIQVRVSCNKFSNDRRENIATILRTLE